MSEHPYPEHVLDAVEEALRDKLYEGALPVKLAETALQALWDASRVDTLDELDALDYKAVVIDRTGYVADDFVTHNDIDHSDLPAHVIYWGDRGD